VANPHARPLRRHGQHSALAAPRAVAARGRSLASRLARQLSSDEQELDASAGAAVPAMRRRWLLSFMGALDVCCEPGRSIRRAMRPLVGASRNDTQVVDVARQGGRYLLARHENYHAAGLQMASSRFCLVPAGDNEVRAS
jgi:hypothetical protein